MKLLVITLLLSLVSFAHAEIKVKDVNFSKNKIVIDYTGMLSGNPELTIDDGKIQVAIPQAVAWPKIEKRLDIGGDADNKLTAYQYTKDLVRVRAYLPYNFKKSEDKIHLSLTGNQIAVSLPANLVIGAATKKTNKSAKYDERLLDQLIIDKKEKSQASKNTLVRKKENIAVTDKLLEEVLSGAKEDKVKTQQSSSFLVDKADDDKKAFSVVDYLGKFVAFIGVLLLGLYGVIVLMKKGVIKKGKLGFLNSTDIVKVINTTHIAPKRSLMLVKAHNQVFLLSNTETGVQLVSEVNDVAGLLKDGEMKISGSNFDSNFKIADNSESLDSKVQLKKDINQSTPVNLRKNDSKFSDKIKAKVKELKPLQ